MRPSGATRRVDDGQPREHPGIPRRTTIPSIPSGWRAGAHHHGLVLASVAARRVGVAALVLMQAWRRAKARALLRQLYAVLVKRGRRRYGGAALATAVADTGDDGLTKQLEGASLTFSGGVSGPIVSTVYDVSFTIEDLIGGGTDSEATRTAIAAGLAAGGLASSPALTAQDIDITSTTSEESTTTARPQCRTLFYCMHHCIPVV